MLPAGWEIASLDELYDFSNGINADKSAFGSGVPFINVLEIITRETLDDSLIPGRVTLPAAAIKRYQVRHGDVLFNRTSETQDEVALSSVYLGDSEPVFGGFVFRAQAKTKRLLAEYAAYALRARYVREQVVARGQGGIRANVSQRDLNAVRLLLPSPNEQQSIAEALADASRHCSMLELAIVKKQAMKQGMMQQLFMSSADSVLRCPLGEVCGFLSGGTPDRSNGEYWSGDIPWISASTLKDIEVSHSDQVVTSRAVRAGSRMAPLNSTLLLVRGSALHSEIRASLVVAPVCFNQDVKALMPSSSLEPKFLTYSIHANAPVLLRLVTSAGNTAGVLDTKILGRFEIWIPDRDTQLNAISILDDFTAELHALRLRLEKARDVKQGMMQELLTGRTRLAVQE